MGKRSTRTASITPKLAEVLSDWLPVRPDGPPLFCQADRLPGNGLKAVTKDEVHDHFKRMVAGSKWASLPGDHVLRYSFISAWRAKAWTSG